MLYKNGTLIQGREISIIGFDDVADASFATLSLTTIQSQL